MDAHPYREHAPDAPEPGPARARGWLGVCLTLLVVTAAPAAFALFCVVVRAYAEPSFMPATVEYAALGYAAVVLSICAVDLRRRS